MRYGSVLLFAALPVAACLNAQPTSATQGSIPATVNLKVMTYNIWFMTGVPHYFGGISPKRKKRAVEIAAFIAKQDPDVVVLQEAFDVAATDIILDRLEGHGFVHSYRPPFRSQGPAYFGGYFAALKARLIRSGAMLDSGLQIISKQAITDSDFHLYTAYSAGETMVNKGVAYTRLEKDGQAFHLFSTHTQAWDEYHAIRLEQFRQLRAFLDTKDIPRTDAALIVGDLNVNAFDSSGRCSAPRPEEYRVMTAVLDVEDYADYCGFTFMSSDKTNDFNKIGSISSAGGSEHLDYILVVRGHLRPQTAMLQMFQPRCSGSLFWKKKQMSFKDLSDHHPLMATFTWKK